MASIEKRRRADGTIGYRVVWRDPDTDRAKDQMTFDDEGEAKRLVQLLDANGQRLSLAEQAMAAIRSTTPTVAEVIAHHIDHLTGIAERTRKDYHRDARRHIYPRIGGIPYDTLDEDRYAIFINDVWSGKDTPWETIKDKDQIRQELKTARPSQVAKRHGVPTRMVTRIGRGENTPMSAKTMENIHSIASAAFDRGYAKKLREHHDNPAKGARLPTYYPPEMVFLTHGEFSLLLSNIKPYYRLFVRFLVSTGLRWGEAVALTVGDFNLLSDPATVRVHKALKKDEDSNHYIGGPKSRKAVRTVAVGPSLVPELATLFLGKSADDLAFTGAQGGAMWNAHFPDRIWAPALDAANAETDPEGRLISRELRLNKQPRIHDLRHTYVSWVAATGKVDIYELSRLLGHESIKTTQDRYRHLMPGHLEAAAEAAEASLSAVTLDVITTTREPNMT